MNIKVGALVQVIHSHCSLSESIELGLIREVLRIEYADSNALECCQCKGWHGKEMFCAEIEPGFWHPVPWLKLLPPLTSKEKVEALDLLQEPAYVLP